MPIYFNNQDIDFKFGNRRKISRWIKKVINTYQKCDGTISYIFTSESYILDLNKKYLNHNYYTDIITFDYCRKNIVEGDIFICVDTVRKNSEDFRTTFDNELLRVIIHGIFHLLGFNDKTDHQKQKMRQLEDNALTIFFQDEY